MMENEVNIRIVTFLGNATYLEESAEKNLLTDVFIDESYVYTLESNNNGNANATDKISFSFKKIQDIKLPYNDRVIYHFIDTGIKPFAKQSDLLYPLSVNPDYIEMINRRVRIARMMKTILTQIDEDILFIDSDVIINNIDSVIRQVTYIGRPTVICIPAKAKPAKFVFDFCLSTNFYLPSDFKQQLDNALNAYMQYSLYVNYPIDLYIHQQLQSSTLRVKGVYHYIDGIKYCL